MIDDRLMQLAFRDQLLDTVVATTGSATLSATSTGYARASGSFLTDGFEVGMEITLATGFTGGNNQATTSQGRVIAGVTALAITCAGCSTESAGAGKTITVGVPYNRAWDNSLANMPPLFPYIEEDLVPALHSVKSFPASSAYAENSGLYVLKVFGLSGKGIYAIRRYAKAILSQFTPGTSFTLSDSTNVRIPLENGPVAGQIIPVEGGWSYVLLEIPYLATSLNTVAA